MRVKRNTYWIVGIMVFVLINALIMTSQVNAATSAKNTFNDIPVEGTVDGVLFTDGSIAIQSFSAKSGDLLASAKLTIPGVLQSQKITIPVAILGGTTTSLQTLQTLATCDILSLSLGPLDLDLLGLVVELDEVNLDITAEAGPGNLVGNLLCAVAGLLDGGLSLNLVADLLNVIVDLFNELGL